MSDRRIIVEVATPELVKRLEARIDDLRAENKLLREQHERLHKTVYRLMETVADLKRNR